MNQVVGTFKLNKNTRHDALILTTEGLASKPSPTTLPGAKVTGAEIERRLSEHALSRRDTSVSRGPRFWLEAAQTLEKQQRQR